MHIKVTYLLIVGFIIGIITKLDQFSESRVFPGIVPNKTTGEVPTKKLEDMPIGWLALSLVLAGSKAALIIYGVYTLVSLKITDSSVALVIAGFATIAYEQIWKIAYKKVTLKAKRMELEVEDILGLK